MSPEFYSRWKFHQKIGIFVLAVMQAFFSCVLISFNLFSIEGIVMIISFAIYMTFVVTLKLYDLYSRRVYDLIRVEAGVAIAIGLVASAVLFVQEGSSASIHAVFECLLTIVIYILWLNIMKFWLKRHFCPREYVCVGEGNDSTSELMDLNHLDRNIFSSGKYFKSDDLQGITGYMQLFKIGFMVIAHVSLDTYRNMLGICHNYKAMAFLTEKPLLPEYEGSIREVYIGGRKLWLYLPQN